MASVFDIDESTPREIVTEPVKRSRNRETLSSSQIISGKRKLSEMVDTAFSTLHDAMLFADYPTAVKAAQTILDRAGYGPKSSIDISSTTLDLTALTREELAERASRVAERLREQQKQKMLNSAQVVNSTPVKETVN